MATDTAPTGAVPERRYRLGVLIVSGLAEPRRGGALIRAADALRGSLDRWVTHDDEDRREARDRYAKAKAATEKAKGAERSEREAGLAALDAESAAVARPITVRDVTFASVADPDAPAHLRLAMDAPGASPLESVDDEWCLAESWWAGDFQPPGVPALTRWVLKVAPIVVLKHFLHSLRRRWRARPRRLVWLCRVVAALVRFCLAPLLSVVAVACALVLVLLASLPLPKLSAAMRGATARLGERIGDSYVLLESPTRVGAVMRRVESDFGWLASRCDRVAIVAEGQGAILAHRCLRAHPQDRTSLFVTVGSGLRKVAELELLAQTRSGLAIAWAVSALTALLVACIAVPSLGDWQDARTASLWLAAYVLLFILLSIWGLLSEAGEEEPRIQAALRLAPDGSNPRWVDFFASADPVPNGPMFDRAPDWIESCEVWSTASTFGDHTSYWRNPIGFVLPLARLLIDAAETSGARGTLDVEPQTIVAAARRRAWRVGWLVVVRACITTAALFAGVRLWGDLESAGASIAKHAPDWAKSAVGAIFKPFGDLLDALHLETPDLIAAALIVVGAGALVTLVRIIWSAWDRREVTQAFRREPFGLGGSLAGIALVVTVWSCIVLVQAGAAGSWESYVDRLDTGNTYSDVYGSPLLVGFQVYGFIAGLTVMAYAASLVLWGVRRVRGLPDPLPPLSERMSRSSPVGVLGGVVCVTAVLLVPGAFSRTQTSWLVIVFAVAWALVLAIAAGPTARHRAEIRSRIIAFSTSDPGSLPARSPTPPRAPAAGGSTPPPPHPEPPAGSG